MCWQMRKNPHHWEFEDTHYVSSFKKRIKDGDLKHMNCMTTTFWCILIFKQLCAKVMDLTMIGELKNEVVVTLVLLERKFPPSFFDIMTHLLVHLVEELESCGPIPTWYMYHVERYLKTLKGYVGIRAKPKGNMVEIHALEKAFGFCTEYLVDFTTIRRQVWMTKKTLPCLMKCLKVVGIHES